MIRLRVASVRLSADGKLPTEMRLFSYGWNRTSKGNFLFDELSAAAVMSRYSQRGVDIAFDLEHLSLDDESKNFDPDARGWCQLELRDGELWAVNIKWNEDGARRIRKKTQRYLSPAFSISANGRIMQVINIAICANPATFDAPQLIAASARLRTKDINRASAQKVKAMDETLKKIAARLGLADGATMEDCVAAIDALKAAAADADPPEAEGGDKETAEDPPADDEDGQAETSLKPEDVKGLPASAQAIILAQSQSISTLTKEVRGLKASVSTSEVDRLIAANTNKIPRHMEQWAKTQTPENLRVYLKHAKPVAAGAKPSREPEREESDPSGEVIELTASEKAVAKKLGQDPIKLLAHKKKLAAKRSGVSTEN